MSEQAPLVGIVMGSDSDLPVMQDAAAVLHSFGIPYELSIVSAHRTPERLREYGTQAESRGLKVVIAGAGGAAHLPGMIAAYSALPVIGVPVQTAALHGLDSLLSIVQMPPGVPVATLAVNGAKNAGLLAAEIVGTADSAMRQRVKAYKEALQKEVADKDAELQASGAEQYLKDHKFV